MAGRPRFRAKRSEVDSCSIGVEEASLCSSQHQPGGLLAQDLAAEFRNRSSRPAPDSTERPQGTRKPQQIRVRRAGSRPEADFLDRPRGGDRSRPCSPQIYIVAIRDREGNQEQRSSPSHGAAPRQFASPTNELRGWPQYLGAA